MTATACWCASCRKRVTLRRHPDDYKIVPKCKRCGGQKYWVDKARMDGREKKQSWAEVCKLDCLPYPHRVNSPACKHYDEYVLNRSLNSTRTKTTNDEPQF